MNGYPSRQYANVSRELLTELLIACAAFTSLKPLPEGLFKNDEYFEWAKAETRYNQRSVGRAAKAVAKAVEMDDYLTYTNSQPQLMLTGNSLHTYAMVCELS